MIDLVELRTSYEKVKNLLEKKDPSYNVQKLFDLDVQVRSLNMAIERLRAEKNDLSARAKSGITPEIRDKSIIISKDLKEKESEFEVLRKEFAEHYLNCPNIPQDDIPKGNKESNKVVKVVGEKPKFNFEVKNHIELAKINGWLDFEAATKMTGSRFALYKKEAVGLVYSLAMLMLKNNVNHGFEPVLPPYLVNEKSLLVASNFPKFKDQVYKIEDENLYLTPTAEVNLTNLYRDHIFNSVDLPVKMTAWTSCFRREAGTYGTTEHGLIRIHQFEKVELVTMCEPENSNAELDKMVNCSEEILKQLGLHYRISLLAGQDCSFASSKTYDIEVWMPGQNAYYEVSSASNCTDFQARRGLIRYKKEQNSPTQLVHTLNASSLALPRLMIALMETYQKEDGSIELPEVLTKLF
ncbi:MAG: serine--tRNA ligase [Candidatus Babeliales bacterium]|nr:serine--tRNA ligase [Candidatus Babeliales bacterium]